MRDKYYNKNNDLRGESYVHPYMNIHDEDQSTLDKVFNDKNDNENNLSHSDTAHLAFKQYRLDKKLHYRQHLIINNPLGSVY